MSPQAIVQAQVEAYNARDLEAFLALHSETAQLYDLPSGTLICEGEPALRSRYRQRFENTSLHAEILNRMVHGNRVIDHERITGMHPDRTVDAVAIYDIVDEKIQRVWFIFS